MKKKVLLLMLSLVTALFVSTGLVGCGGGTDIPLPDDPTEIFSFVIPSTVETGTKITPQTETKYEGTFGVTVSGPETVTVGEDYSFTVNTEGKYTVSVTFTLKDGKTVSQTYTFTAYEDLTAPTVSTGVADKSIAKGVHTFAADLAEAVAEDNKTAAAELRRYVREITLDGTAVAFTAGGESYDFVEAGVYTVTYVIQDEWENSVEDSYELTVAGIRAALTKTEYLIDETVAFPEVTQVGGPYTLTYRYTVPGGEQEDVTEAKAFYTAFADGTLDIIAAKDGTTVDSVSLTFTVRDIPLETVTVEKIVAAGAFTVPQVTCEKTVVSTLTAAGGEPETVTPGESVTLTEGTYYTLTHTVTAGSYSKAYSQGFYAKLAGEVASFESLVTDYEGKSNELAYDMGQALVSDAEHVKYGKNAYKLNFDGKYAYTGMTYWENARLYGNVADANAVRFDVYVKTATKLGLQISTGATSSNDYTGAALIYLGDVQAGWNTVTAETVGLNGKLGKPLDLSKGVAEFALWNLTGDGTTVSAGGNPQFSNCTWSVNEMYVDAIRLVKVTPTNSISMNNHQSFVNYTTSYTIPTATSKRGAITEVLFGLEGETGTAVQMGDTVTVQGGCAYSIVYKAEAVGYEAVTRTFGLYVRNEKELISFERIGDSYDGFPFEYAVQGAAAEVSDEQASGGRYSLKLSFDGTNSQHGIIDYTCRNKSENKAAAYVVFDLYVSDASELKIVQLHMGTGSAATAHKYISTKWKLDALQNGWNTVTVPVKSNIEEKTIYPEDGLAEFYFRLYDSAWTNTIKPVLDMYVDSIRVVYEDEVNVINGLTQTDTVIAAGASFTVPEATAKFGTVSVTMSKDGGEAQAVTMGGGAPFDGSGLYTFTYSAPNYNGTLTKTFDVYVRTKGEIISFERIGDSYDGFPFEYAGQGAAAEVSDEQASGGRYSLKLSFDGTNSQHGIIDYTCRNKSENKAAAYVVFDLYVSDASGLGIVQLHMSTGSAATAHKYISTKWKLDALQNGWNTVTVPVTSNIEEKTIYPEDGLAEFYFRLYDSAWTNTIKPVLDMYVDSIRVVYEDEVNAINGLTQTDTVIAAGASFTVPEATAKFGTVSVTMSKDGGEAQAVTMGGGAPFDGSGLYTFTYSVPNYNGTLTKAFDVYVRKQGEILSFEKNGAKNDDLPSYLEWYGGDAPANRGISSEQAADGRHSLKLSFDGTNFQRGFANWGGDIKSDNPNAEFVTFKLYISDVSSLGIVELRISILNGNNGFWALNNLKNGWNEVKVPVLYDSKNNKKIDPSKGITEMYIKLYDKAWSDTITPVLDMYLDSVCVI